MRTYVSTPGQPVPEAYFDCRYKTLREPLGFIRGEERLNDDDEAIHAWIEEGGRVVAVGRVHLIPTDSNGEQADHGGGGATRCPAFEPLDGNVRFPHPDELRPAFQIRQMGVDPTYQRQGIGRRILDMLELEAIREWSTQSGWLQARKGAIAFYATAGWEEFGDAYDITRIGEHRSMWKCFITPMT